MNKTAKELVNLIKESETQGTKPYDTQAEVIRVEDGTCWVHIPGGVDETPVQLTIAAKAGDTVQVRVANGRAWLVGNASAPPTDDGTAIVAQSTAVKAEGTAKVAQDTAEEAEGIALQARSIATEALAVGKHFFVGQDGYVHITETENDYNTGNNVLIDSDSVDIRDGTDVLASFGQSTTIGESGGSRVNISPNGILMYDDSGNQAVNVKSGGSVKVPFAESFTALSRTVPATVTTHTYTTPVLSKEIAWGTLTVRLYGTFAIGGYYSYPFTLTFSSASDTPSGTWSINGTVAVVTGSIVGGNKVRLRFTSLAEDVSDIQAVISYTYSTNYNYMRIRGETPQILLRNDGGGSNSSLTAYKADSNGNNLVMQAGGNLFVGSGEYAYNRYAYDLGENTGENTYIGSDGQLYLETNGNDMANRKTWRMTAAGGHLVAEGVGQGVYGVDVAGQTYPYIRDNGTNLWIGATSNTGTHHAGNTIISSGIMGTGAPGNETIYVAVATGSGNATDYEVYHRGYPDRFRSGDSIALGSCAFQGFVTNSTRSLDFYIPLPKLCDGLTPSITWGGSGLSVRGVNGYLDGSQYMTPSNYTIENLACRRAGVWLRLTKSSAFTNGTNNTPCSVTGVPTISFT